jgi:hypothetical protein
MKMALSSGPNKGALVICLAVVCGMLNLLGPGGNRASGFVVLADAGQAGLGGGP